jgi:outer membrane protein assembly factor BamB
MSLPVRQLDRCCQVKRFACVAAALWLAAPLRAATTSDWPMFRGSPALLGVAEGGLPSKLGMLWTFKTAGPVRSTAAISKSRVFIGSNDANVYALNFADGKKIWAAKTGAAVESSPLALGDKVFAGSADNFLYALDAASGSNIWKYETGDKILGAPNRVNEGDR